MFTFTGTVTTLKNKMIIGTGDVTRTHAKAGA